MASHCLSVPASGITPSLHLRFVLPRSLRDGFLPSANFRIARRSPPAVSPSATRRAFHEVDGRGRFPALRRHTDATWESVCSEAAEQNGPPS